MIPEDVHDSGNRIRSMNGEPIVDTFLTALTAAQSVIAAPQVASRWEEASVLPQFSVRGLAGHLARAALTVDTYLDRPVPEGAVPISVAAYYAHLDRDLASPAQEAIRQRGEETAAGGQGSLLTLLDDVGARLASRLREEEGSRLLVVAGNAVMSLNQYLRTRIVELTVHSDDLALSAGLETPALPPDALHITIETLLKVARARHGELAVVRALARRERDTLQALRVF